jgi:hypothetical protein
VVSSLPKKTACATKLDVTAARYCESGSRWSATLTGRLFPLILEPDPPSGLSRVRSGLFPDTDRTATLCSCTMHTTFPSQCRQPRPQRAYRNTVRERYRGTRQLLLTMFPRIGLRELGGLLRREAHMPITLCVSHTHPPLATYTRDRHGVLADHEPMRKR